MADEYFTAKGFFIYGPGSLYEVILQDADRTIALPAGEGLASQFYAGHLVEVNLISRAARRNRAQENFRAYKDQFLSAGWRPVGAHNATDAEMETYFNRAQSKEEILFFTLANARGDTATGKVKNNGSRYILSLNIVNAKYLHRMIEMSQVRRVREERSLPALVAKAQELSEEKLDRAWAEKQVRAYLSEYGAAHNFLWVEQGTGFLVTGGNRHIHYDENNRTLSLAIECRCAPPEPQLKAAADQAKLFDYQWQADRRREGGRIRSVMERKYDVSSHKIMQTFNRLDHVARAFAP